MSNSTPQFTETSSADIGNTSTFFFEVIKSGNTVELMAEPTSGNWIVILNRILI